ncbi:phosphoglycerate mutase [Prauserella marina]|uniref:Probable phosphoglycerate mutase n=1 Tax=Prauserella marina TaxID=530584 RepID=A0A222VWQ0_9PSEU|nr:histidine phosphatase family protein [Prauserella marina]ASR38337.1 phosphoglycerate mutase [Prauserella marina]PWV78449.1 putative phosphoglycerate mutase [Prauserella marina]SDC86249.1 probable phosphoglycerate mutase [Prauserella marina]
MSTRLLLVRHGETEWHADNRYAGTSDVGLTPRGFEQAAELAGHLRTRKDAPTALYCSPQSRARRTAEPSAHALGLTPTVVADLAEVHFGLAEGRTLTEVRELGKAQSEAVEKFLGDPVGHAFPDAESPTLAARRGASALRAIAEAEEGPVLVVAHNTLLRLSLCLLLGIPLRHYRTVFPRIENCAITELGISGDRTSLLGFNIPAR